MEYLPFIGGILAFLAGVVVTRWVFGIDQMLKAHKTVIGLLILQLRKNGATKEEIDDVIDKVYGAKS